MLTKSKYSGQTAQVWSQRNCPACEEAKRLLELNQIAYEVKMIGVGEQYSKKDLIDVVPTARSVPQIMLNGTHIGGLQELKRLLNDNDKRIKME
jgi:glutaredoxin